MAFQCRSYKIIRVCLSVPMRSYWTNDKQTSERRPCAILTSFTLVQKQSLQCQLIFRNFLMYLQKQTFKQWHIWGSFCAEDSLCEILCLTPLCYWKPPRKRVVLFLFCVKPCFTRRAQLTSVGHPCLLWKAGHVIWRCDHHVPWYHPIFNLDHIWQWTRSTFNGCLH